MLKSCCCWRLISITAACIFNCRTGLILYTTGSQLVHGLVQTRFSLPYAVKRVELFLCVKCYNYVIVVRNCIRVTISLSTEFELLSYGFFLTTRIIIEKIFVRRLKVKCCSSSGKITCSIEFLINRQRQDGMLQMKGQNVAPILGLQDFLRVNPFISSPLVLSRVQSRIRGSQT